MFTIFEKEDKSSQSPAFTLAEVLITLGIIGVVAAMLIPNLIADIKKRDTAVKLEKMYSTISQATQNSELENGLMQTWESPVPSGWADINTSKKWWDKYFIPYANLAVVKQCDSTNIYECWPKDATFLDGSTYTFVPSTSYVLMLKDGSSLALLTLSSSTAQFSIDINGLKGPNIMGKDIFYLFIQYPYGKIILGTTGGNREHLLKTNATNFCNKDTGNGKGLYCGRVIQLDGWQIKDDYPW